jgi:geranylgeranyl diphosphate synthase type I
MAAVLSPSRVESWFDEQRARVEATLSAALHLEDEQNLDTAWSEAWGELRGFVLRPGKRVRPLLVLAGHAIGSGELEVSEGLLQFAASSELLHAFTLIHDDVADRADSRRGGPALHRVFGSGRSGENLAVVAGDHLFALAMELAAAAGLPRGQEALRMVLRTCRHTAAGQFLDLALAQAPLSQVSLFQTIKVAQLKTARFGFVSPLGVGATLAGASPETVERLERAGRAIGIAFQLSDDLLGLYGDDSVAGKPGASDFYEAKRTFPLIAAYCRARAEGRAALERLWDAEEKTPAMLEEARARIRAEGGVTATRRLIDRSIRAALRTLAPLPNPGGVRDQLAALAVLCRERRS